MNLEKLQKLAQECGFTAAVELDADTIRLRPEVRQMCEDNKCHQYGKNWKCPPGCGTLEECEKKVRSYAKGILVQTMGELEDEMDVETMMELEAAHKENFEKMRELLAEEYPRMLSIGSGTCTKCKVCTYPDAPCRFPEHSFASMESYGMMVMDVCKDNGLKYYYGPCTLAYTSCFLLEEKVK